MPGLRTLVTANLASYEAAWADQDTWSATGGKFRVESAGLHPNRRTDATPNPNQWVEVGIEGDAGHNRQMGGMVRMGLADFSGYGFMWRRVGNSEIFRTNAAGADTTLGSSFNLTSLASGLFRLEVRTLSDLTVQLLFYVDGALSQTRTDTSGSKILIAGRLGAYGNQGGGTAWITSWRGGNTGQRVFAA